MPFGLPKNMDNKVNNEKMESCVSKLMGKGQAKESAIKICKKSLIMASRLRKVGDKNE